MGRNFDSDDASLAEPGASGRAAARLRIIMIIPLVWAAFVVVVPDFVMGMLNADIPQVHAACDISAVAITMAALLYLFLKIRDERRVTSLLLAGTLLLVLSQASRAARILGLLDFLHQDPPNNLYDLMHIFDDALNGFGLVFLTAAFFMAIVDLFAAKQRLTVQQEHLSEEILRRTRSEQSALQEKQQHEELLDSLPIGVFRTNPGPDGRFLEVNPAQVAILEADSEEELRKHRVSDVYRFAADRDELSRKLLQQGFVKNEEVQLLTLKGRPIWGSISAVTKHDQHGQPYFNGLVEDITLRVEAQESLALERARMVESARLASLGAMAGGIAHEINNPLAVISGCAEQLEALAADQGNEGPANRLVPMIHRHINRIKNVLIGLRSLSHDASDDPFEVASIANLVAETLAICQERFRLSGIRLENQVCDKELAVECRAAQIGQVILSLLNNSFDAVKDLPAKWVRLSAADLGDSVEIAVEDSGGGIPTESAGQLFRPFFTTKAKHHALGLGLSICRTVVEAHHGVIDADHLSSHTRFFIHLPKLQLPSRESRKLAQAAQIQSR